MSSTTGVRMDFEAYRLTRSAKQSPSGEAERTTSPPTSPRLIPEAYGTLDSRVCAKTLDDWPESTRDRDSGSQEMVHQRRYGGGD